MQDQQQLLLARQQSSNGNGVVTSSSSSTDGTNLPSANAQQEKPSHYTYLKEFRVEACPLFKQHQCTNHRPYSCFYWHFANQRRRRPVRRKDGTFNYSADVYCTKYDENTGVCPDGDECPFLHRVYGDVERKYHLRYYKTALCVHQTDPKGHCIKNGAHCAFAHGPDDVRNPIFDIRELQSCGDLNGESIDNRERLNFVVEDPLWQDQEYVLINYKTEPCKKPPRLCRQGYACPYYHNTKDKRRMPSVGSAASPNSNGNATAGQQQNGTNTAASSTNTANANASTNGTAANGTTGVKYRSTPCPNVKHGDEWGDPEICESGENCPYCHTRTEQQFHPEIYKSTKCNDMLQHGYCPRGPFCAFAHTDGELHGERRSSISAKRPSVSGSTAASFANVVANLKAKALENNNGANSGIPHSPTAMASRRMSAVDEFVTPTLVAPRKTSVDGSDTGVDNGNIGALSYSSVLKQRHASGTSIGTPLKTATPIPTGSATVGSAPQDHHVGSYSKAPGFEREQQSPTRTWTAMPIGGDTLASSLEFDRSDATRIKSNLYFRHEIGCDVGSAPGGNGFGAIGTPPTPGSMRSNSFSPFGAGGSSGLSTWQHQHQRETVESVVGSVVEDINLEELVLPPISERDERGESLPSSLSHYTNSPGLYGTSAPVTIPGSQMGNGFLTGAAVGYGGVGGSNSFGGGGDHHQVFRMSGSFGQNVFPDGNGGATTTGMATSGGSSHGLSGNVLITELQRTGDELTSTRQKLMAYEEQAKQARQTCDAWKREAVEQRRRAELVEQERLKAEQERDGIASQLAILTNEFKSLQLSGLWPSNTDFMAQSQLEQLHSRLRAELDKVERQLQQRATGPMCARCGRHVNGSAVPGSCPVCSPNSKSNGQYAVVT